MRQGQSRSAPASTPGVGLYAGRVNEFERDILGDRVKAGIDQARKDGKPHGRPKSAGQLAPETKRLRRDGLSKRAIAAELGISPASVDRWRRPKR